MRIVVSRLDDFPPGTRRIVTEGRRSIGVFRVGDRFFAVNNHCPHLGGPLCEGRTQSELRSSAPGHYDLDDGPTLLACPWHGWEYDLATGQSWFGPEEKPVRTYEVSVEAPEGEGPQGRRPGPYVAETYDVAIERLGADAHVVVDTSARPGGDTRARPPARPAAAVTTAAAGPEGAVTGEPR
ncbi:MAG: Rieske (2Fe-2S) protein [Pseudonocardia sp.]|uniref:Rieske (2Fe-2S) protein n=1 Tax=unclassified Pseudonocardia TaxID=2619320 RepID=UPI000A999FB9|nr:MULTISPECIES: Rieske (2Fe-2S) protein [unclassified Pseudonocardia]MBN9107462.1 Rieske (2Fe-2S) protein [Pseudonocardia sp.]